MQLINNDCDIDLDVLNDYNWHIIGPLIDLFENFNTSTNIFCGMYYPTLYRVIMQITNIYIVLNKYLDFENFNDTILVMVEKILKN